jgi:hypothetical protein
MARSTLLRLRPALLRFTPLALGGALAACASTPVTPADAEVRATITSAKTSENFAECAAENVIGGKAVRSAGDHHWITFADRDTPGMRWDFFPAPEGSKVEIRSEQPLAGEIPKAIRDCV